MTVPSEVSITEITPPSIIYRGVPVDGSIKVHNMGEELRKVRIRLRYQGPVEGDWLLPKSFELPPRIVSEHILSINMPPLVPTGDYRVSLILEGIDSQVSCAGADFECTIATREGETYDQILSSTLLDGLPDPISRQQTRLWAAAAVDRGEHLCNILREVIKLEDKDVLVLGCGDGGEAIAMARQGARVVATDFWREEVERTKIRARECNVTLTALVADAQDLAPLNMSFDLIILAEVIEHVDSPARAAAEIAGVLRPDGIVYLSTPNKVSIRNFLSDSHSNLFGVSLFPRSLYHFYVKKIRRRGAFGDVELVAPWTLRRIFAQHGILLQRKPLSSYDCQDFLSRWKNPSQPVGWQGTATRLLKTVPVPEKWSMMLYEYLWAIDAVWVGHKDT